MNRAYESDRSVLDVPEQLLDGIDVDRITEKRLGRSCLVHCIEAARETFDGPVDGRRGNLIAFIMQYGHETSSDLYHDGAGWITTQIAELLRLEGHPVVVQNPSVDETNHNRKKSDETSRAKSEYEHMLLKRYARYGGSDKSRWLDPISETLAQGGLATVTINIPLLSGGFGSHSVLVTDITDKDEVLYFDPDWYYATRYTTRIESPDGIRKYDEFSTELFYVQPKDAFTARMEPNIMHILPAKT